MDVFDRLEVAFGGFETETVAFLQRDLDVLLRFRFGGEGFAFGELLVVEEGAGVFGDGGGVLLVVVGWGVVSVVGGC